MRGRIAQAGLGCGVVFACLAGPGCGYLENVRQLNNPECRYYSGLTRKSDGKWYEPVVKDGKQTWVPYNGPEINPPSVSPTGQPAASGGSSGQSTQGAAGFQAQLVPAQAGVQPTISGTVYMPDGFSGSILILDAATLAQTGKITPAGQPFDALLSPDHSLLYTATFPPQGGSAGGIAVINTATQTIASTISLPGSYPQWLALSPDGSTLYVADNRGTYNAAGTPGNYLIAIDTASGAVKATIHVSGFDEESIGRPVASPDGSTVYVPDGPGVQAVDTTTLQPAYTVNIGATMNIGGQPTPHTVISPDGRYLYVPSYSSVQVIDAATRKTATSIALPGTSADIQDLSMSGDGSSVLVADVTSGNTYQISTASKSIVATIAPPGGETANTGNIQLLMLQ